MRRLLACVAVAVSVVVPAVAGVAPSSAATHRTITIGPGANVAATLGSLRAGDILRLQPGTYNISNGGKGIHPRLAAGTAAAPIVVTAVDSHRLPLLQGSLFLDTPTHWILQFLRFQGTISNSTEFYVAGGVGWSVRRSEFFGASTTGSFANVAISNTSTSGLPQHWQFVDNCVHDGGHGTLSGHSPDTDQNVYISASGNAPGLLARNVIYNATAGYNVKIGDGGGSVPGASNVHVLYNTMVNARRQVLVLGKLTGVVLSRNILELSTRPSLPSAVVYYSLASAGSSALAHNYVYRARPSWYAYPTATSRYVSDHGDNQVRSVDPRLSGACGMHAQNTTVARNYGTNATGAQTPAVP